jgi:S1-C subfamily serine protease
MNIIVTLIAKRVVTYPVWLGAVVVLLAGSLCSYADDTLSFHAPTSEEADAQLKQDSEKVTETTLSAEERNQGDVPALERRSERPTVWRTREEERTIQAYKKASPSVVFITTVTLTVDPFDFLGQIKPQEGSGSGVIVDAEAGIILTNLHVIQNAHQIQIMLDDGRSHQAKLLGYDREYDLAVLKLEQIAGALTDIPFGDSGVLEVGQRVLAIGNPFGLDRSLTQGIVSSLNRTVRSPSGALMRDMIQTDAAINPGNSGGPLLDGDGKLIGINTVIVSNSGDSAGVGFAVPINHIRAILPELIATGKVLRPQMGWVLVNTNHGVMVRRVIPGGPADEAGLAPIERIVSNVFVRGYTRDYDSADLLVAVNGAKVATRDDVSAELEKAERGAAVTLTVRRGGLNGEERKVELKPILQ